MQHNGIPENSPSTITDQNFLESKSKIAWYIGHNLLALLSRLEDPEHTDLPNYLLMVKLPACD